LQFSLQAGSPETFEYTIVWLYLCMGRAEFAENSWANSGR